MFSPAMISQLPDGIDRLILKMSLGFLRHTPRMRTSVSRYVLDIMVQSRRDKKAKKFFRQLLKGMAVCPACDRHRQAQELQCR
jgi:hypothetical protein